jgi:hypothetical protein
MCSYHTWKVVPLTRTVATTKMHGCTNAEYANMNFEYGFCNGNALAETREYQHRYPD